MSKAVSIPKKVIANGKEVDLASTPGGTVYGTTPGGTRVRYDKDALLNIRNSPMSKGSPAGMASIPGITLGVQPAKKDVKKRAEKKSSRATDEEDVFQMES